MDEETRVEVLTALATIWEGQHWTRNEGIGGRVWPESLVVVSKKGVILGHISTMAIKPDVKRGLDFPIRADVLTDNYVLTYDPVNQLCETHALLSDYHIALEAIATVAEAEGAKLQAMAKTALSDVDWAEKDKMDALVMADEVVKAANPEEEGP